MPLALDFMSLAAERVARVVAPDELAGIARAADQPFPKCRLRLLGTPGASIFAAEIKALPICAPANTDISMVVMPVSSIDDGTGSRYKLLSSFTAKDTARADHEA